MPCIIVILASNLQLTPLWSASRTWGNTWERSGPRRDSRWGRRGGRGRSTCSCWRRHSCWPRGSDDPSWARSSHTRSNGARGQASRTHTSHNSAQRPANGNIYSHAITSFFRPLWRRFTVYFHYSWPGWSSWPQAGPCRWRSARGTSAAPHRCRRSPRGRAPPGWGRTSWGCRPASSTLFSSTSSNFYRYLSSVDNNLSPWYLPQTLRRRRDRISGGWPSPLLTGLWRRRGGQHRRSMTRSRSRRSPARGSIWTERRSSRRCLGMVTPQHSP